MKLDHAAPTFLISDVGATTEWYQKELGFDCSHFPKTPGVLRFYESLKDRPFIRMHLRQQRYEDTEFEVIDPNGYILVFSELIPTEDDL